MVSCVGRVRFHHEAQPREIADPRRWTQPLTRLPPTPEDALLQVRLLEDEEEALKIARELHIAAHLGGHALWKLFRNWYCPVGHRLWPPPEDDRHHSVPRAMGYPVHRYCGPSTSQSMPRVPDCLRRLLLQIHHPHPFQ